MCFGTTHWNFISCLMDHCTTHVGSDNVVPDSLHICYCGVHCHDGIHPPHNPICWWYCWQYSTLPDTHSWLDTVSELSNKN